MLASNPDLRTVLVQRPHPLEATQANTIKWCFRDLYRNGRCAALSVGCASPIPVHIPKTLFYSVCLDSLAWLIVGWPPFQVILSNAHFTDTVLNDIKTAKALRIKASHAWPFERLIRRSNQIDKEIESNFALNILLLFN